MTGAEPYAETGAEPYAKTGAEPYVKNDASPTETDIFLPAPRKGTRQKSIVKTGYKW